MYMLKIFKSMFIGLMITLSLQASTVPIVENVTELYVATFNRAADSTGLDYWVDDSGLDLELIAQSFFDQSETQELYPPGTSAYNFVWAVYANLFNRTPDPEGLTYWEEELRSGRIPRSVFILAVINGAQNTEEYGNDAIILENKTIVGLSFSSAELDDVEDASGIMMGITDDYETVTSALIEYDIECVDGSYPPSCEYVKPIAVPIAEASFYRAFDGKDYYTTSTGKKVDFNLLLSTMSSDGKVVAFYGNTYFDYAQHYAFFIHNFESTEEPTKVNLPASIGSINTNAGLVSNADGSRIFFVARRIDPSYTIDVYCMVNGLTGEFTELLSVSVGTVETPQDIATDAAGDYLYFNESDNGDRGDLWRIQAIGGAVPEMVIQAGAVPHPSGGFGRFIDQFDISDDGKTIAFFIEGRIENDTTTRVDKELFVKTTSGIRNLTNNTQDHKDDLVISGDASTIVYVGSPSGSWDWMVTSPDAVLEEQRHIEIGYSSCGDRPGISTDGSIILGCSNPIGVSSAHAYLIKTDGSSRRMVEPSQIRMHATSEGLHLSGDGERTFFRNRWYVYPEEWYNMTVGVFGPNLWPTEVPSVTGVSYPGDMYTKLEDNEQFEIKIMVSDPQDVIVEDSRVKEYQLFPTGYLAYHYGPISIFMNAESVSVNLYTAGGQRGSAWPDRVPTMTARFSVRDDDFNVGYVDTLVKSIEE